MDNMDDIEGAFQTITRELEQFQQVPSLQTFTMLVAEKRGKLIRFDNYPLKGDTNGMCISLSDCDLVRVCTDMDDVLEKWTKLHELCHLYLGHLTLYLPLSYKGFLSQPPEFLEVLHHRPSICLLHSEFVTERENATETLTTKLIQHFNRFDANMTGMSIWGNDIY